MKIGLTWFPTHTSLAPAELARTAEDLGFESAFVPEHTHIPTSRATPYPAGGDLPEEYWQTWDPFVACTAMATVTERLVVGTAICLVNQHHPIALAKQVATVSHLSGGRFVLGVGPGWNAEEMGHHGIAFDERFSQMRERIEAMRRIWTQDEAEYHGQHVDFDPLWSWPKPAGHVPVLVAGWGKTVEDRVLGYGDGWMPIGGRAGSGLAGRIARLRERAGHDLDVTVFQPGPNEQILDEYAEAGVTRVLCALPRESPAEARDRITRYAGFLSRT